MPRTTKNAPPCPKCEAGAPVLETWKMQQPLPCTGRRRECSACRHRFTTYEVTASQLRLSYLIDLMLDRFESVDTEH